MASQDFEEADQAVLRAAAVIEATITKLLEATLPLERVATDYVIETLVAALIERNPEVMDYLNRQRGEATMMIANALMDWRDKWVDR